MLVLGSKTIIVDGITVYADHADRDQFWCLPGPVALAHRGGDKDGALSLYIYKPATVAAGVKGGGFLTFETDLHLDEARERKILSQLSAFSTQPRLSVVPFDRGTVKCVALNLEGASGTDAQPAPPGAFNAVEQILGATIPSLDGINNAAFSLTLSQEGAIILKKAFEQGTTPVGVVYDLTYTAMRPALKVKIVADMKRIYDHFSASLTGRYYWFKVGVEAGLEWLKQNGAISIEVEDATGTADRQDKEKWALDFFKDNLLRDWFDPTLTLDRSDADSITLPGSSSGSQNTGTGNTGTGTGTGTANTGTGTGNTGTGHTGTGTVIRARALVTPARATLVLLAAATPAELVALVGPAGLVALVALVGPAGLEEQAEQVEPAALARPRRCRRPSASLPC